MSNPAFNDAVHDEAEELLPWYATGQLNPADRGAVERHLASCARCQRQLAFERQLIEQVRALDVAVDSGWARLRARIVRPPRSASTLARATRGFWDILRRPGVAAIATAQVVLLLVAAAILVPMSQPSYQALGSSGAPATANIIVIFRPGSTEQDIRELLRASDASVVGGPTAANAYLLHVRPERRPAALAALQSADIIQLAQPVDDARS
ncbi:MAG TPA: anti-sigma factor [Sphingomicrobium sp.]|nr:anti-sigma factor [Sphingomicrobium sp.]